MYIYTITIALYESEGSTFPTLSFKPDVFTLHVDGIHDANLLPKTIYHLKRNSDEMDVLVCKIKGKYYGRLGLDIANSLVDDMDS